jgi:hypothetical protein
MQLGNGIKESSAEKLANQLKPDLRDEEVIVFVCKCNNFKPMVDRVVLTNQRLLAASLTDGKIKYWADHDEVADAVADSNWSGATLTITKRDGACTVFKSMDATDAEAVRTQLTSSKTASGSDLHVAKDADSDLTFGVPDGAANAQPPKPEPGKSSGRAARWKEAAQGLAGKAAEEYKQATAVPLPPGHDAETHGRLLRKAQLLKNDIPGKTIELYEGGFVRVVGMTGEFGKPKFERLVSVTYRESTNTYTRDQSAVGGFLVTSLSLGLASNENVKSKTHGSITVATDGNVYSGDIKPDDGRALEALADGILKRPEQQASKPAPSSTSAPDIAEQIRKLADLHAAGILTDDEFSAKKADLLDRM